MKIRMLTAALAVLVSTQAFAGNLLPIAADYCGEIFNLTAAAVEYEEFTCAFTNVDVSASPRWVAITDCYGPTSPFIIEVEGNKALVGYPNEDPDVLWACPEVPAS